GKASVGSAFGRCVHLYGSVLRSGLTNKAVRTKKERQNRIWPVVENRFVGQNRWEPGASHEACHVAGLLLSRPLRRNARFRRENLWRDPHRRASFVHRPLSGPIEGRAVSADPDSQSARGDLQ